MNRCQQFGFTAFDCRGHGVGLGDMLLIDGADEPFDGDACVHHQPSHFLNSSLARLISSSVIGPRLFGP